MLIMAGPRGRTSPQISFRPNRASLRVSTRYYATRPMTFVRLTSVPRSRQGNGRRQFRLLCANRVALTEALNMTNRAPDKKGGRSQAPADRRDNVLCENGEKIVGG